MSSFSGTEKTLKKHIWSVLIGSASPFPCPGGCPSQPGRGSQFSQDGAGWRWLWSFRVYGPALISDTEHWPLPEKWAFELCAAQLLLKPLTGILKGGLKDPRSMHSWLWPFHGSKAQKSLPRKIETHTSNGVFHHFSLSEAWVLSEARTDPREASPRWQKEASIFANCNPSVVPAKSTVLNEPEPHLAFAQKSSMTSLTLCVGEESARSGAGLCFWHPCPGN